MCGVIVSCNHITDWDKTCLLHRLRCTKRQVWQCSEWQTVMRRKNCRYFVYSHLFMECTFRHLLTCHELTNASFIKNLFPSEVSFNSDLPGTVIFNVSAQQCDNRRESCDNNTCKSCLGPTWCECIIKYLTSILTFAYSFQIHCKMVYVMCK